MELVHSTFQASFNARIERLAEQEANELRTIFRYFDTDDDGAVSADQALRIFGFLGLDINPAYVRDLEEVYLAEFLKIVDTNVPITATATSDAGALVDPLLPTATASLSLTSTAPPSDNASPDGATLVLDEQNQNQANAKLWEDEWRAIDSYRRGYVTRDEFRFFLRSCFSPFPIQDLDRLLELYSDSSMPEDSMTLTKAQFLKFRYDYTHRERLQSEHEDSSEDDDGEGDQADFTLPDLSVQPGTEGEDQQGQENEIKKSRTIRETSISQTLETEGEVGGVVIDTGVMDDEFVDDDDGSTVDHNIPEEVNPSDLI